MKIIRVTAMWCTSCLLMKKRWKSVFSEFPNIEITDFDYDEDSNEIQKYQIGSILPVLILFDQYDIEVIRLIGEKSVKEMLKLLGELQS